MYVLCLIFVFKTEMKKKCQVRIWYFSSCFVSVGYVHDSTTKLLACLLV